MIDLIGHYIPTEDECDMCESFAVDQDDFEGKLCEEHLIEAIACEYADRAVKMAKEDALLH